MQQINKVKDWIKSLISSGKLSFDGQWSVLPLQGDASCRQYFRLINDDSPMIVMLSPIDKIDNQIFIERAVDWLAQGVNVPKIYQVDHAKGLLLIEDLGVWHLYDQVRDDYHQSDYHLAIDQLLLIQQTDSLTLPVFDEHFLRREMLLFDTWMVQHLLALEAPACLADVYEQLIESALSQPQVAMHRDYHSRNLLLLNKQVSVIDFQDAVLGPLAYDLASLLKDCYFVLPASEKVALIDRYLMQLNELGLLSEKIDRVQFIKWFDWIALQRHLKVLGLFVRLAEEEGKTAYLADISTVFSYVLATAKKYPEFADFARWLQGSVLPKLQSQPWYQT